MFFFLQSSLGLKENASATVYEGHLRCFFERYKVVNSSHPEADLVFDLNQPSHLMFATGPASVSGTSHFIASHILGTRCHIYPWGLIHAIYYIMPCVYK